MARPARTVELSSSLKLRGGELVLGTLTVPVGADAVLVGRDASCDLVLDDRHVSGIHAEFRAEPQGVRVRDLGSRNGVFVGGVRLQDALLTESCVLEFWPSCGGVQPQQSPTRAARGRGVPWRHLRRKRSDATGIRATSQSCQERPQRSCHRRDRHRQRTRCKSGARPEFPTRQTLRRRRIAGL